MATAKGKQKQHSFPGPAVMSPASLPKANHADRTWGREKGCHEVRWEGPEGSEGWRNNTICAASQPYTSTDFYFFAFYYNNKSVLRLIFPTFSTVGCSWFLDTIS